MGIPPIGKAVEQWLSGDTLGLLNKSVLFLGQAKLARELREPLPNECEELASVLLPSFLWFLVIMHDFEVRLAAVKVTILS